MYSDYDFTKVYLMLGEACNFKCRHCLQNPYQCHLSKHPSPKLIAYLQHLADIRPRPPCKSPSNINLVFFGGEPLLYWKEIEEVITLVDRANVDYTIITNGSLLTLDQVKKCNEQSIEVVLSHDGVNTCRIRDKDMLEDYEFCQLFKQLDKKSVCTTLHAYNQDLYALWDYLEACLGKDIGISYQFLEHTWDMPKDIFNYDLKKWEATCEKVCENLYAQMTRDNNLIESREGEFLSPFINNRLTFDRKSARIPRCGAYRNIINLDMDGHFWLCHNGVGKFAHCTESGVQVAKQALNYFGLLTDLHKHSCNDCVALPFCHKGCPLVASQAQAPTCEFMQVLAKHTLRLMDKVDQYYTTDIEL